MTESKLCDSNVVTLFINNELDADRQAEFSVHLESCSACQHAVENAAADEGFWSEVVEHLGAGGGSQSSLSVDAELTRGASEGQDDSVTDHSLKQLLEMLSPTDDPAMLGRIGEYEIAGIIGVGGMGAVFKGFDRSLMRVVAIKVMAPQLANKGSARKRFEREARAAAAISHDNVIDIYRVDELNGLPYLVMPFARGPSLQTRLDKSGPLSATEVVLVGKQIAAGLAAAHEQGLVHRDIKPANILLNDCVERILITDFGVARAIDDASMTQTGLIAGTPQYMSPEQARGEFVDQRSDLFSLGSLLYTACTGRPPFRSETPFGILRKITDSDPRSILEINPEIPLWLVKIIDHLLEKDTPSRFQSATEVATLFEKCLAHLRQPNQMQLPRMVLELPVKPLVQTATEPRKKQFTWLGIATSVIALGVLGLLAFFKWSDPPNITGVWAGESWKNIRLNSVKEADDWYAGSFTDADGNDGAIHLEWSPMEQRFKGRWSVDSETSGTIVLRQASRGAVRGAIMFDSGSETNDDAERLRDFAWQAKTESAGAVATSNTGRTVKKQLADDEPRGASRHRAVEVRVYSAFGVVTRIGRNIRDGAPIKKGEFILEYETIDRQGIESDQATNEKKSIALQARKDKLTKELKLARSIQDAEVNRATAVADAAKAEYESKSQLLVGYQAKLSAAELNFQRKKKLTEKALETQRTLESVKRDLDVALAEVEAAKADGETLSRQWKAKVAEVEIVRLKNQQRIDEAVFAVESIDREISRLRELREQLNEKLLNIENIRILAPADGVIQHRADALVVGSTVTADQLILTIVSNSGQAAQMAAEELKQAAATKKTLLDQQRQAEVEIDQLKGLIAFREAEIKRLRMSVAARQRSAVNAVAKAAEEAYAAQADYQSKLESLDGFKAIFSAAAEKYESAKKMAETGSISQSEIRQQKDELEVARSRLVAEAVNVDRLKKLWELKKRNAAEQQMVTESKAAETQLEMAVAELAKLRKELKDQELKRRSQASDPEVDTTEPDEK